MSKVLNHPNYFVNSVGKIISRRRSRVKILRPYLNRAGGYLKIRIDKQQLYIHRIVWESFCGEIPLGMHINHINGIKTDNRLVNLEIVTPSQNMQHAYKLGLKKPTYSPKIEELSYDR